MPKVMLVTGSQPGTCGNDVGDFLLLRSIKNKMDYVDRRPNMEVGAVQCSAVQLIVCMHAGRCSAVRCSAVRCTHAGKLRTVQYGVCAHGVVGLTSMDR